MQSLGRHDASVAPNNVWIAILLGPLIVAMIVYAETFFGIVDIWLESKTYVHGFVIVPVSIMLIWRCRGTVSAAPKRPFWPGLIGLLTVSGLWWVSNRLGIQAGEQFSAVTVLPMVVLTTLGVNATSRMAFPLAYLVFAVPFGDFLIPSLVEFTAQFTVGALNLTGIPVLRDAQFFRTPAGDFEVARACSGVRFLLASLSVGALYAYLNFHTNKARVAFIVFSALFPIVANGVRVYLIVLVAHFSDMRLAVGVDHIIYGWVFFGIIIVIMLLIGNWTSHRFGNKSAPSESVTTIAAVTTPQPAMAMLLALLTAIVLAVGPAFARITTETSGEAPSNPVAIPAEIVGWDGPAASESEWRPEFANPASQQFVSFSSGTSVVELVVVQYASVSQSAELANSQNMVMGEDAWTVKLPRVVKTGVSRGPAQVREIYGSRKGEERLVWYWYDVNGSLLLSMSSVKLQEAMNWLAGKSTLSTLIAISMPVDKDYRYTSEILSQFLAASSASIDSCITSSATRTTRCTADITQGVTD